MITHSQDHQPQRYKWLLRFYPAVVISAAVFFIAGAVIWTFDVLGIIPGLRSTFLLPVIIVLDAIFSLFLLIFLVVYFSPAARVGATDVASTKQVLQFPLPHLPPTQSSRAADRDTRALLPLTDARTIQQREKVVKEVYKKLVSPDISSIVLTGIAGVGKSTLAGLIYNYAEEQRRAGRGIFTAQAIWLKIDSYTAMINLAMRLFEALGKELPDFGGLSSQDQAAALFNAINKPSKVRLIVLDQFENLLDWHTGKVLVEDDGIG